MAESVTKKDVKSPCISVCALDDHDICIGCYRSLDEIARWRTMSEAERVQVMHEVALRAKKNNPFCD